MHEKASRGTISLVAALVAVALAAVPSDAQVRFGGQLNGATDTDFGLGPRVALDLQQLGPRFQIVGTWDIYFPDTDGPGDLDYWELNGNVVYRFDLPAVDFLVPYGGGGLNVARRSFEGPGGAEADDTDIGINGLAGVEFPLISVTPFVEIRGTADGGEQFYFTGGVMIP